MADIKQKQNVQTEEFMRIQDLLYLCLANWKWFILSLVITLSVATIYILRTPPVYTRSASIMIKSSGRGNSMSSEFSEFENMGFIRQTSNVNNELMALQSPAIMYEVVKRLNLDMNYSIPGKFHDRVAYGNVLPVTVSILDIAENQSAGFMMKVTKSGQVQLSDFVKNGEEIEGSPKLTASLSDTLQTPIGRLVVTPTPFLSKNNDYTIKVVRSGIYGTANRYSGSLSVTKGEEKSSIINLAIRDVSTQRAEDVLNTVIAVYNENWVKDRNQIAVSTSLFINDRLSVIESELGNVDEDISSYKSENLMPDVKAASSMYMNQSNQANEQIMALNNQLYMARYIRNYLTNEANEYQLLPANSGIANIDTYNTRLLQRNSLVANSSVENPLVIDMDKGLEDMRQAIVISIDNQIEALNTQINSLQKNAQKATSRIAASPSQAKYLLSIERQQKVKESLYLYLLQKREENELSQAFTAYNTRIINPPSGSMAPSAPLRKKIYLVAFAIGLLVPVVIIFMKETMNTKIRGRKDLANLTIPFIGEIPMYGNKKKYLFPRKKQEKKTVVVKEGSRDIINEAFRVVRTNLEFMTEKSADSNVIVITSFNPGSGKSFLSINMAISLAIKNKKVLLIDGDLRHASTSSYVGSPTVGLSDYLNGRVADLNSVVVQDSTHKNLHVLPVGTIPPNPTELLYDNRMKQIIDKVRGQYDYVLIDCPPVEMVADTQILEKFADRTIFVVRAGLFERNMLSELENLYQEKKYKNMSIILNCTEGSGGRYGYKYGYRYAYHYGYGYGYGYNYGSKA